MERNFRIKKLKGFYIIYLVRKFEIVLIRLKKIVFFNVNYKGYILMLRKYYY